VLAEMAGLLEQVLKETITNRLMVFERKILKKIYGPT
jgi:hypothetical protein